MKVSLLFACVLTLPALVASERFYTGRAFRYLGSSNELLSAQVTLSVTANGSEMNFTDYDLTRWKGAIRIQKIYQPQTKEEVLAGERIFTIHYSLYPQDRVVTKEGTESCNEVAKNTVTCTSFVKGNESFIHSHETRASFFGRETLSIRGSSRDNDTHEVENWWFETLQEEPSSEPQEAPTPTEL